MSWIDSLAQSSLFMVVVGIMSIMGTIISIRVLNISKNIREKFNKASEIRNYNAERVKNADILVEYNKNVVDQNIDLQLVSNIRTEIEKFKVQFSSIHTSDDKKQIDRIERIINVNDLSQIKPNQLSRCLSYLIARYGKEEHNL